jgi:ribonuclease HI
MDRVQEIAEAIAELRPEEKRQLFELLALQGDLPEQTVDYGLEVERPELLPWEAQPAWDPDHIPNVEPTDQVLREAQPGWEPDYLLVFDGGSRGNPGWGYGSYAIIRVQDGAQRLKRLELGDSYTNNEAEYDTLVAALKHLIQRIEQAGRQPREFAVEVRGDSTLVINQLLGTWKAKDPRMRERRGRCLRLLGQFGAVELKTQPREESVRVLGH